MGMHPHIGSPLCVGGLTTRMSRSGARAVATGGAVVAMAAILGMASPINLATSMSGAEPGAGLTSVLAHPDAALVAPDRVVAWTAVTLAVCIFLSRHAQIAIARPTLLVAGRPRPVVKQLVSRSFLHASRAGGLYGG